MLPVIALVGRPNVGKSTLFNRLTHRRDALVADTPGLTRDRQFGYAKLEERHFIVIDTGGLSGEHEGIDAVMEEQTQAALAEADSIFYLVDGQVGLHPGDQEIADQLRRLGKPVRVLVNKAEGRVPEIVTSEFHGLGLGEPLAISGQQGQGVRNLLLETLPVSLDEPDSRPEKGLKVAVVGRPNVGKSTLINAIFGAPRVITFDEPGTTRDSIHIPFERDGKPWTLIDTAGVRRRGRVDDTIEKFSIIKTLGSIDDANVCIMVMDARQEIADQDLRLLGTILERGRALVLAINKWDNLPGDQRQVIRTALDRKLPFLGYVRRHFISALNGTGLDPLLQSVQEAYDSATVELPTPQLCRVLEGATKNHPPPLHHGRRIKLRYAHQGGRNPPAIIIHGNQVDALNRSYKRYLENQFREAFGLHGTPLEIALRQGDNPYRHRRNKLTDRQLKRSKRNIQHLKKKFG
ncbi:MAG: ribosome biogenesis GTPase Der [Gammaproteobacteria bacterium]|nr:ribosome biogenesis GTPase Der [Gammaproteobacteria bacterium]